MAVGVESGSGTYNGAYGVAKGVVHRQVDYNIAVASVCGLVPIQIATRVRENAVKISKRLPGTNCIVSVNKRGVEYPQIDIHTTITAINSLMHKQISSCLSIYGILVSINLGIAYCVVHFGMESVFYMQQYNGSAVAAEHAAMQICYGGVVQPCVGGMVVQQSAVGKGHIAAGGVVAGNSESVVNVDVYHHSAVAVARCAVVVHYGGVVQLRICGAVGYQTVAVNKGIVSANGVVTRRAESVVDMQKYHNSAVAAVFGGMPVFNSRIGLRHCGRDYGYQPVAVGEHPVAADGVVAEGAESVEHIQIHVHVAVAAIGGLVHVLVTPRLRVRCVGVGHHLTGANGVVNFGIKSVVDMQTYHHQTVAALQGVVKVVYSGVVQLLIGGQVSHQATAVNKWVVAADGVVAYGAESVVDVDTYHHSAVAVPCALIMEPQHRIKLQRVGWNKRVMVIDVHHAVVAADGAVYLRKESVVDMQKHHHRAVAAMPCAVPVSYYGIVPMHIYRTVAYKVVAINESVASADGVVAYGAESVVDMQFYHHIAVATLCREMPINYRGVVHPRIGGDVSQTGAVVFKYVAAANGVVTHGSGGVVHGKYDGEFVLPTHRTVGHRNGINTRLAIAVAGGVEGGSRADGHS